MNRNTFQTSSPTICQLSVLMRVRWQLGGIPGFGRDCVFPFLSCIFPPSALSSLWIRRLTSPPESFLLLSIYMYPATTFGYVTTAGAPNVSIPSPNSGCSTRSRSVFPIRHAFGSFPMAPLDPERYYTLACRIKTNRTRSDLSVYSFPSPFNTN